jgi:hypothetical protein
MVRNCLLHVFSARLVSTSFVPQILIIQCAIFHAPILQTIIQPCCKLLLQEALEAPVSLATYLLG